jgi:hypothetical protein
MKRPLSITIIGWLFIAVGVLSLAGMLFGFAHAEARGLDYAQLLIIRLLGLLGGIFLLRRANWARWLLIAWLAFHVAISHDRGKLLMHVALLIIITFFLFRPRASAFLRPSAPTS